MIPGSGVLAKGLLYTKMARYMFKLRKLRLHTYGHKARQLAERHKLFLPQHCVLLSVGVQASLLQPLVNRKHLEISAILRSILTQNSDLGDTGAVRAYFQQPNARPRLL